MLKIAVTVWARWAMNLALPRKHNEGNFHYFYSKVKTFSFPTIYRFFWSNVYLREAITKKKRHPMSSSQFSVISRSLKYLDFYAVLRVFKKNPKDKNDV